MSEEQAQDQVRMPRIGEKAPSFDVLTTHGQVKLEDYQGKYLVLFSHPADFTPVCTTEFVAFQAIYPQLRELNTELLGLSIDSNQSHLAWVQNIQENFNIEIEFPVIADLNKDVASKYGMLMPGDNSTETSRAVFVIDDKQVIRGIIYYPLQTGRNMDEIVRLVKALQTTDKHKVSTPANWEPGDKVIVPPPATTQQIKALKEDDSVEIIDWYLTKKSID